MACFRRRLSTAMNLILILLFGCTVLILTSNLSNLQPQDAPKHPAKKFVPTQSTNVNCTYICSSRPREKDGRRETSTVVARRGTPPPSQTKKRNDSHIENNTTTSRNVIMDYPLTWSTVDSTGTTIFSAYYDERPQMYGPSIVILGYQLRQYEKESLYCLFKYNDGTLACRSKSIYFEMDACNRQKETHKKTKFKYIHVFHICTLEPNEIVPAEVALSDNGYCNPSCGFVTVNHYRPSTKAHVGVCVETPIFRKSTESLVNFIEMNLILGVDIFTMYFLDVSIQTESSLDEMYNQGKRKILDIVRWNENFKELDPLHYYGEILAIQDCIYRNMYRVDYLLLIDLDELLITRRHDSLKSMLAEIDQDYVDSFIFINSVYLKTPEGNLPKESLIWKAFLCKGQSMPEFYTHFAKSKCRYHYHERSKLIIKPQYIIDSDIHGVCTRVKGKTHFFVPDDMATSHHYRAKPTIECRKNRKTKKYDTSFDDWLKKYAKQFFTAVRTKLCSN